MTPMQAIVLGGAAGLMVFVLAALLLCWDCLTPSRRPRPLDDRATAVDELARGTGVLPDAPEVDLDQLADAQMIAMDRLRRWR